MGEGFDDVIVVLHLINMNMLLSSNFYWFILPRFCHDVFDRDYKATIGVDFEVEKFSVLGVPFNLQM